MGSNRGKLIIRLVSIGIFLLGMLGNLPQGWAIGAVAVGLIGFIASGGGGG